MWKRAYRGFSAHKGLNKHAIVNNSWRLALAAAVLGLVGCVVNPVTGENEFSLVSPEQEVAIGAQNYQPSIQAQGGRYVVNPELTPYINSVGQKLAAVSDRPNLPYEFVVLNNDTPNAWALPGGKIAINRGLLRYLENEAQLAAVLAHEIVHAAARHSAQQMTQGALLGAGAQILTAAGSESGYGDLIATGAGLSVAAWQARYGREHELQADRVGMEYMSQVGYDPMGAVELQRTFVELSQQQGGQDGGFSSWFASHPPSQQRVEANLARAQTLAGDTRNREAYQRAIAEIKKNQPAYETHEQAIAAIREKNLVKALSLTEQAINMEPRQNHFWETKAHILASQDKLDAAVQAYSRAIELYPEYFSPLLGRGSVELKRGNFQQAEADLLRSREYLETQTTSYLLGQVSLQLGKTDEAVQYFRRVAAAGGDLGQAAQQQLQRMGVAPQ